MALDELASSIPTSPNLAQFWGKKGPGGTSNLVHLYGTTETKGLTCGNAPEVKEHTVRNAGSESPGGDEHHL